MLPKIIQDSIDELRLMCYSDKRSENDENRSPFLEKNRNRVREIGKAINREHGFRAMVLVHDQMPLHDQRELEVAWDGIGDWQC